MHPAIFEFRFGARFEVAVASHIGYGARTRPENQDNFVVIDVDGRACHLEHQAPRHTTLPHWPKGHARVAVLDGMGGHGHGREAAEAVAAALLAIPPCTTIADLSRRLDDLHADLQRHFLQDVSRPGTTLTLLELPPDAAPLLYHVGDSRLYELGAGTARPLTVDHVPATGAAMEGQLDATGWWRQVHARHAPQIAQAFILGNTFADPARLSDPLFALTPLNLPSWLRDLADRRTLALHRDCVYLLATDGFWSCMRPDAFVADWPGLLDGCPNAASVVERLFEAIAGNPPPGLQPDNLTALVLRPLPRHGDQTGDQTALPVDADQTVAS